VLFNDTTGDSNTALGVSAGFGVTTASSVIYIGAFGANANNSTWIGNVYGVTTRSGTTAPVVVSHGGQLGTVASSERFKKDITNMAKASETIFSLRPATFHYRSDARETP
jgi:Chaperone of endosialidase